MGRRRRSIWPSSRRRRSTSGDAAIGILIGGAIAVAVLGVYLLIVGAIALVGWLIVMTRKHATTTAPPTLVAAPMTASAAPLPHQLFHPVRAIDPVVFSDPRKLEATVASIFGTWAAQLPGAPRDPCDVIRRMELRTRVVGRLTSRLDGTRFVWRSAPHRSRERNLRTGVPLDHANLDPYNPPRDLKSRSMYLSLCSHCAGDGSIECVDCGGASRVTCRGCNGAGKLPGVTASGARRLLNCKACKGKASVVCAACTKGHLECASCRQSGRVEHWLEVDGGPRDGDFQIEPDGELTKAFRWGRDGIAASNEEVAVDARIVCSVTRDRILNLDDLPPEVPAEWKRDSWQAIQARLQPGERLLTQTFTLLEVPSVEVTYAAGGGSQTIAFEGRRLLAPPASTDTLFARRASSLRRLVFVLGAIPFSIFVFYAIRGPYFLQPAMAAIVGTAAVAAAIIYMVLWCATLGRSGWRWLGLAIPPLAVAVTLAILLEPQVARARSYMESGQLALAKQELEALALDETTPIWADIHLKEALQASSCSDASQHATRIIDLAKRASALAHADRLALQGAHAALGARELDAAMAALQCASEITRSSKPARGIHARVAIARGKQCIDSKQWECAFAHATEAGTATSTVDAEGLRSEARAAIQRDLDVAIASARDETALDRRVATQQTAVALWSTYLLPEAGSEPPQLISLRAQLQKDQAAFAKANLLALQQQAAEAKRLRAAEARTQAREEAAAERLQRTEAREESRSCCKICSKGYACGDTCISRSRTCHVGRGCAC